MAVNHWSRSPCHHVSRAWTILCATLLIDSHRMAWQTGTNAPFAEPGYENTGMGIAGIAAVFCFSWAFSWSFGPGTWSTAVLPKCADQPPSLLDLPIRDLPHEHPSSRCFRLHCF